MEEFKIVAEMGLTCLLCGKTYDLDNKTDTIADKVCDTCYEIIGHDFVENLKDYCEPEPPEWLNER